MLTSCEKLVPLVIAPFRSHFHASLGLARRLQAMGYVVEYWGDEPMEPLAKEQGFNFEKLPVLGLRPPPLQFSYKLLLRPVSTARQIIRRKQWRDGVPDILRTFGESLDALVCAKQPLLAIFDPFRLGFFPFFRLRRIPVVVLSTKPLLTPDPHVPPYTSGLVPRHTLIGRHLVRLSWLQRRCAHGYFRALSGLARRFGELTPDAFLSIVADVSGVPFQADCVPRWVHYDLHCKNIPEWVLATSDMDFKRRDPVPRNVYYIGPCVDIKRDETGIRIQRHPSYRHFIYVAVGSGGVRRWDRDIPFLRKILQAFSKTPEVQVVVSTGDDRVTNALAAPSPNITITTFVEQLGALDAADLMITHAGSNSVRECISKGVPMLAYPREYDQPGVSARIVYLGIGLRGRRKWDGPKVIRRKAFQVLENGKFRAAALQLKARVEASEHQLLVDAIADAVPSGVPDGRR